MIGPDDLSGFVSEVDARGGPGDPRVDAYWRDIQYRPRVVVDTTLDPFGPAYMQAQLALYRELSGRSLDQSINEHTVFNREPHLISRNPYNHGDPGALASQLVQLANVFRLAKPKRGDKLLDMGCGWGLSSELAAYLGLDVLAVDINPDFVDLVRARSDRYRYGIDVACSAFDDFTAPDPFDLILFYECLHHAVEPWRLLRRLAGMLAVGGKILACGEPINVHWWPHWGLRLDPLSIYCIHKHGWFESGWSEPFIVRCLDRALLDTRITTDPDPRIGSFLVASKSARLSAAWMIRNCALEGGSPDGDYIVAGKQTNITLNTELGPGRHHLVIHSFRQRPVGLRWRLAEGAWISTTVEPGETRLPLSGAIGTTLSLEAETWVPADEIGNLDTRRLAFQLAGVEIDRAA